MDIHLNCHIIKQRFADEHRHDYVIELELIHKHTDADGHEQQHVIVRLHVVKHQLWDQLWDVLEYRHCNRNVLEHCDERKLRDLVRHRLVDGH